MTNLQRPVIFLDRDGVINQNRIDYVKSWAEFVFLPGVFDALRCLSQTRYVVVIVTNQSVIGRGIVGRETIEDIHRQMLSAIRGEGGRIDAIYLCPHHPAAGCDCRKPRPGLLQQAARDLGLDLSRSFFIGDAVTDMQAALAVGCRPILVLTGRGEDQRDAVLNHDDSVTVLSDLAASAAFILSKDTGNKQDCPVPPPKHTGITG